MSESVTIYSLIYVFRKISLPSAVKGSSIVSCRCFTNFEEIGFVGTSSLAQPLISCE